MNKHIHIFTTFLRAAIHSESKIQKFPHADCSCVGVDVCVISISSLRVIVLRANNSFMMQIVFCFLTHILSISLSHSAPWNAIFMESRLTRTFEMVMNAHTHTHTYIIQSDYSAFAW